MISWLNIKSVFAPVNPVNRTENYCQQEAAFPNFPEF